jgi:exonuclease III
LSLVDYHFLRFKKCKYVGGVRLQVRVRRHCLLQAGRSHPASSEPNDVHYDNRLDKRFSWFRFLLGAFIGLSIAVLCSWFPYHGIGIRVGEACHPGPRNLKICSLNINSARLHIPSVSLMEWDVLCAQETGCSFLNFSSCASICQESGVQLFHGPLLPSSMTGGVAICTKGYPLLEGQHHHSEHYDFLLSLLRWKHVMLPLTCNTCVNLHTIYGYSGANNCSVVSHRNETLLQSLFLELAKAGDAPTILMGDFNVDISNSPTLLHATGNLGWVDVLHTFGDSSGAFYSTQEDFVNSRGSRIDFVLANPTALSIMVSAKVVHTRRTGGHSPVIIELDSYRVSLKGFKLNPLKNFDVPPVQEQDPDMRAAALRLSHRDVHAFRQSLSFSDLSDSWRRLNGIIDDYLKFMELGPLSVGEHKSSGFTFSSKQVLPPTVRVKGAVSACSKQVTETLRIVNILLDLKYKVKRGDQSPIIERHWQRCKVALDGIPIPALVQNLASIHNACPEFWVLDTMHGALHQFMQVVDRANGKQRADEVKCRLAGPHAFWKAFRPPRPRPPRAIVAVLGTVITDPQDYMPAIFEYWHKICNSTHQFQQEKYLHRYRVQMDQLSRPTIDMTSIAGHEFMAFSQRMSMSSPGLDGRSVAELRALPLDIWDLVAEFWEQIRCHPGKLLPDQLVTAGVHLIPKPGHAGGVPKVGDLRPITVLPLLFRVWSGIQYARLRQWMQTTLPPGITGGKAGGEVASIALQLSLSIEESKAGINPFDTFILTTDFSKFFDALNWGFMFSIAKQLGIPDWLCDFYRNYLGRLCRHFIFGSFFNPTPCTAICGIA